MKMNQVELLQRDAATNVRSDRAKSVCERAKELEEAGKFEDARLTLGEFWQRIGDRPKLDGLEGAVGAELLLRAGALSG